MPKVIKGVMVQIVVSKDGENIQVEETAHLTVSSDEYPDMESKKGIQIDLTSAQETAIISHVKNVVLPQAEEAK